MVPLIDDSDLAPWRDEPSYSDRDCSEGAPDEVVEDSSQSSYLDPKADREAECLLSESYISILFQRFIL